jgi:hypothetical protein
MGVESLFLPSYLMRRDETLTLTLTERKGREGKVKVNRRGNLAPAGFAGGREP